MDSVLALFAEPSGPSPGDSRPHTLCAIKYADDYSRALQVFQRAREAGERSDRVLRLTECIVTECEGHYTAWGYRRECLPRTLSALEREMEWINAYTRDCPKNYQLWQHRMHVFGCLMALAGAQRPQAELDDVKEELDRNPKNYHAWQHRQWVLRSFKCDYDAEYGVVLEAISEDPFNNSAFNHLVFLNINFSTSYVLPPDTLASMMGSGVPNKALHGYLEWWGSK